MDGATDGLVVGIATGIVGEGAMILDFCVGNGVGMETGAIGALETGGAIGALDGAIVPVGMETGALEKGGTIGALDGATVPVLLTVESSSAGL